MQEGQAASFRDPSGQVFFQDETVLRRIEREQAPPLLQFLESALARGWISEDKLASYQVIARPPRQDAATAPDDSVWMEHPRVPFVSYPYEWPVEMLHRAAELTLELAEGALGAGFVLKDATPYNIQFRWAKPLFVDHLSFEKQPVDEGIWRPGAQFIQTFLFPLMACRTSGLTLRELLLSHRDGLSPEMMTRLTRFRDKLRPPYFSTVTLPLLLESIMSGRADYERRPVEGSRATYVRLRFIQRLRKYLRQVAPVPGDSAWTDYASNRSHYSRRDLQVKEGFTQDAVTGIRPRHILDIGCNTGHFSRILARAGAPVVAIDQDPASVGRLWQAANDGGLPILPLVVDICRPTPSMGWRNAECSSFLDRCHQRFDMVVAYAVLHHMMIAERIPLDEILKLLSGLSSEAVLLEFVPKEDAKVKELLRGRDDLHQDLTVANFETSCRKRFQIVRAASYPDNPRRLYLLSKK